MTNRYIDHYELNVSMRDGKRHEHWARVVLPRHLNEHEAKTRALAIKLALEAASPGGCFEFALTGYEPTTGHPVNLPEV